MRLGDKLGSSAKSHKSRIILALDVTGPPESRSARAAVLLRKTASGIAGVKINFQLLLPRGLEGIEKVASLCAENDLPLIADVKMNDIESTNMDEAELLFSHGVDAVIANPFAGFDEGLSRVIHLAADLEKGVLLLVYMSHAGAKEGYGLKVDGEPLYVEFARRVRDWGADGAIVSARSPQIVLQVRKVLGKEKLILSPGVGAQGGDPSKAVRAGADFVIVGRSVVDAPDPAVAVHLLNRSMPSP